jgi:hypothetical protein
MDETEWTVKSYAGPEGERMWAVVHRRRPMFLAVVSDRSVDTLREVPLGAVYWAKPEVVCDAASFRRRAIEVLRERRGGREGADDEPATNARAVQPRRRTGDVHGRQR